MQNFIISGVGRWGWWLTVVKEWKNIFFINDKLQISENKGGKREEVGGLHKDRGVT